MVFSTKMFNQSLTVKYISSKNSFCVLSLNNFKQIATECIKLSYNKEEAAFFSVHSSFTSLNDESIGINSLYAKLLGIEENSTVLVSEIAKPATIQSVVISAVSNDDHDILELLADNVQSTLLQQSRLLYNGQKLIIFIANTLHVTVNVYDSKPNCMGWIENLTEVIIKPPSEFVHSTPNKLNSSNNEENQSIFSEYLTKNDLILRLVPLPSPIPNYCNEFNVFALKTKDTNSITNLLIYTAKLLTPMKTEDEKTLKVRVLYLEDIPNYTKFDRKYHTETIFVSGAIQDYFSCQTGSRLLLEPYSETFPNVEHLEVFAQHPSIEGGEIFQKFLADSANSGEFLINVDIPLDGPQNLKYLVRFSNSSSKFCLVNEDFVRNCKIIFFNQSIPNKNVPSEDNQAKFLTNIVNFQQIIDDSIVELCGTTPSNNNTLITGSAGTGKSTLTKVISGIVTNYPYYKSSRSINCKSLKGKSPESLHKYLSAILFELIHHQPSVLILDDLEVLCETAAENDPLALYHDRVSEMMETLLRKFCDNNDIKILATTKSTSKLNKYIYSSRGNYFFSNISEIGTLTKSDRFELINFFVPLKNRNDLDVNVLSERTESFVIRDVADFSKKILFESYQEGSNISIEQCDGVLEELSIFGGAKLQPPSGRSFKDIGGLHGVKCLLTETMLWPSKHPNLFADSPLRLPSGLLLYGPPGTGKTILAAAAARECGLRFISIKGPELLSKYIGASEQAVRDVFQRAQSARPCILFFDEFDSLAPRRGHDNTGVTDRVVNQLLTQLDGVESLSGVFVLAATSRPDLLDPALLRPGRLDRHIACPLPDKEARLEILEALSRSSNLSEDVDLSAIAEASPGFSGADLQAVLYTAQLETVKDLLEEEESGLEVQVNQEQLVNALKTTRPSLNRTERGKYENIYRRFEGGSSGDFAPGSRATLA